MANEITPRNNNLFNMTPFNFFEDFGRGFFDNFKDQMVKTDIHENDTEYLVEAELPGFEKDNVNISYENDVLTIEATHKTDDKKEDDKGNLVRSERSFSAVRRQFLISNIDKDKVKAKYEEGILKIVLPKSQANGQPKSIIPIE
ncbi:MAG: Hsp20/alpha crystallin family protein [Streptococcaceae bacterium]|nr:Hsp20/alpha crystallin family protein [Streptococcaceae bacterium]